MNYPCKKIFVILGSSCNLSCKYCMQHPIVNTPCPVAVNPDVVKWIDDISANRERPVEVCFYGGEPLLYFQSIKEVVGLSRSKNVVWSIITNGKALTDRVVDFLNAHDFRVAVSWDGERVKDTRGYDAVKENLNNIVSIENLCLTGVATAKTYPFDILTSMQAVDDLYYPVHRKHIGVNIDFVFGHGILDPGMCDIDEAEMRKQMGRILEEYDKYVRGLDADPAIVQWVTRFLELYVSIHGKDIDPYCQNGLKVLNVDLDGNLYLCHNNRTVIGNIHEPTVRYVERWKHIGDVERRKSLCNQCRVRDVCGQFCRLADEATGEKYWCGMRKMVLPPVIDYIENQLQKSYMEGRNK